MTNNKDTKIVVDKTYIEFMGEKIYPPFKIEDVKSVLGEGRYVLVNPEFNIKNQVWDELGIFGWLNDDCTEIKSWGICIAQNEKNLPLNVYQGKILIGKKEYTECKWKVDPPAQTLKNGCFRLYTLFHDMVEKISDITFDSPISSRIIIEYTIPKPKKEKSDKYKLKHLNEPVLEFVNFNFKLAVIQLLMYKKGLLTPRFDIYEFAEEYTKRKIDIDEDGYEPIKEALDWFKALEIPQSMAEYVDELIMDGGNDIYGQIIPFWDGEDGFFDIDTLDEAEVKQFPNLHYINLMSINPEKAIEVLEKCGVSVELL